MKVLHSRSLTLLEVVIGFALTAILLASLFSSFRHIASLGLKVQEAREIVHNRTLIQLRLSQLFDQLIQKGKEPHFYLDAHPESFYGALYFTFDNGMESDPQFCGTLNAALFLNAKKQLCLSYGTKEAERKEILLTGIRALSFEFFNTKNKAWELTWKEKNPPPVLKLKVDKTAYTFLIPESA